MTMRLKAGKSGAIMNRLTKIGQKKLKTDQGPVENPISL
jgi:hypothetical protein